MRKSLYFLPCTLQCVKYPSHVSSSPVALRISARSLPLQDLEILVLRWEADKSHQRPRPAAPINTLRLFVPHLIDAVHLGVLNRGNSRGLLDHVVDMVHG